MNTLEILGKRYGTDKIPMHEYHRIYPMHLDTLRDQEGAMIEIGLYRGSSLQMWLAYFPLFFIYGIDINTEFESPRAKMFKADQSSEEDLDRVISEINKPIYFINDDGSHVPEHQLLTFNKLFPLLENNGVYIIEDIETSYWKRGSIYGYEMNYGYKHPKSIVEIFKEVTDHINKDFISDINNDVPVKHLREIHNITFSRNCIIIIKGKWNEREYPYKNFI